MGFERGQRVETLIPDQGFEDSFFPGVVISKVSEKTYIVQYSTLCAKQIGDYDEYRPLREFRQEKEIRPTPPDVVLVSDFVVNDKVDAFYREGWWYGTIRRVRDGKIKKYVVHFEGTKENIEFEAGDLRIHQVWSQGQWYIPRKVLMM